MDKFYPRVTEHSPKEIFEMHDTDLTKGNLLDPLTFEEGEIDQFVRDNSCGFCGGHLFAKHAPGRKYTAHCPEHGVMRGHSSVSKYKSTKAKQHEQEGKRELREDAEPRDEETILKELGF